MSTHNGAVQARDDLNGNGSSHPDALEQERAARARAEAEAARLTRDLAAAQEGLDAFAYAVSHDLRAPLRAIDGFSRILVDDYAAELPADAAQFARRVQANSRKLSDMIEALLTMSRLMRRSLRLENVAPCSLMDGLRDERVTVEDAGRLTIVVGALPVCRADSELLRLVFSHLFDNAIKFSRQCPQARVELGSLAADEAADAVVFYVRDNGCGFDASYADKLFKVFQRLHSEEMYEGLGVGLAQARLMVERMGGRMWVEAAPDAGATFYFALPAPGGEDAS